MVLFRATLCAFPPSTAPFWSFRKRWCRCPHRAAFRSPTNPHTCVHLANGKFLTLLFCRLCNSPHTYVRRASGNRLCPPFCCFSRDLCTLARPTNCTHLPKRNIIDTLIEFFIKFECAYDCKLTVSFDVVLNELASVSALISPGKAALSVLASFDIVSFIGSAVGPCL